MGLSNNLNISRFHNTLFLKVIFGYSAAKRHNLSFYETINIVKELVFCFLQSLLKLLPECQCKEAAEHMPSYCFISLMKNGPRFKNRLHIPEDMLHRPEFLVLESDPLRRQIGCCLKDPLPVESRIGFYLYLIDSYVITIYPEVLSVSLVSDKHFRIFLYLLL